VGQISAFPIDFAGRPYNTLTLPCERVMDKLQFLVLISVKIHAGVSAVGDWKNQKK